MSAYAISVEVLVVISGVVAAGLVPVAWWNRHLPGMYWFMVHVGFVALWSFVDFGSFVADGVFPTQMLGLVGTGLAIFVVVPWFLFLVTYLGYGDRVSDRQEWLLLIGFGGTVFILAVTSYWNEIIYENIRVVQWESAHVFVAELTHVDILIRLFVFLIFFIGLGLLFHAGASGQLQPAQAAILIIATLVPVTLDLFSSLANIPLGVPVTQNGTALSVVLYAFGLHRYDLFRFSPATERIGIDCAFAELDAGVLVTEADGQIIRANDTCCAMLETSQDQLIDNTANSILATFGLAMDTLPDIVEHNNRYYRVSDSIISDDNGDTLGHSILFFDVTEQRLREQRLDVLNRVLRHNIRNDLQVIKTTDEMLAENLNGEHTEIVEQAIETADSLIATSNKARSVEQQLEKTQTQRPLDVHAVLQGLLETYRDQFPDVSFTLTCPGTCTVEVPSSLKLALENLIENAAQHNDNPTPTVDITVMKDDNGTTIEIADNGPGIAAHELAVFDEGEETALDHASGMGLWAVHWVVAHSAVEVEYDTGFDGTTVTLQISQ